MTTSIRNLVTATRQPLDTPLTQALPELTRHTLTPLKHAGITTLAHLAERDDDDLLDVRNVGVGRLAKLRAELERVAARA